MSLSTTSWPIDKGPSSETQQKLCAVEGRKMHSKSKRTECEKCRTSRRKSRPALPSAISRNRNQSKLESRLQSCFFSNLAFLTLISAVVKS